MDNEFADLEAELLRLQPRQPGPRLQGRLADELDPAAIAAPAARRILAAPPRPAPAPRYRTATSWTSWKWSNWAVAAALAAVLLTLPRTEPGAPGTVEPATPAGAVASADGRIPVPELHPVRAGRLLLGSRSDGVVELADGSAVERVRDFFVDTIEWRDPAGTAQLRWELPREAVRYVGLAAY